MPKLTDLAIKRAKPKVSAYYKRDDTTQKGRGRLVVKVHPTGKKVFYFQYYKNGKPKYLHLGLFDAVREDGKKNTVANVKPYVERYGDIVSKGGDLEKYLREQDEERELVLLQKERERLEEEVRLAAEAQKGSISELFEAYTNNMMAEGKRTYTAVLKDLEKEVYPVIDKATKASEVTPRDIAVVLSRMIKRGAPVHSNRIRSFLMAAFNYGIHHDNDPAHLDQEKLFSIEFNPVSAVPKQKGVEKVGERDLKEAEIVRFWTDIGADWCSKPIEIAIKLCFATGGQRPNELLAAEWSEVDFKEKYWEFPASKTKNKRAHIVPLTKLSLSLLKELQALTGDSRYLFPKREDKRSKSATMPPTSVNRAIYKYCRGLHIKDERKRKAFHFDNFVARDIRRTCKTRMGEIGIDKTIRDRIANHAMNDVSSKHYDRYDYLPEKRSALNKWCSWLDVAVRQDGKVVNLKRKRK